MGKGRRGRSKRKTQAPAASAAAAVVLDESPVTLPSVGVPSATPVESVAPAEPLASSAPAEPLVVSSAPAELLVSSAPSEAPASSAPAEDPASSAPSEAPASMAPAESVEPARPTESAAAAAAPAEEAKSEPEVASAEPSVPPVGDLDARFFAESSSEAWLAHELELRDPQFLRKMTANVARRRAHLARYVVGVVGVAVALCLAALIKSAVPIGGDDSRARPAAQMAMPAGQPAPVEVPRAAPVETIAPAASAPSTTDGIDAGGG